LKIGFSCSIVLPSVKLLVKIIFYLIFIQFMIIILIKRFLVVLIIYYVIRYWIINGFIIIFLKDYSSFLDIASKLSCLRNNSWKRSHCLVSYCFLLLCFGWRHISEQWDSRALLLRKVLFLWLGTGLYYILIHEILRLKIKCLLLY
jgi:hypothetical protein